MSWTWFTGKVNCQGIQAKIHRWFIKQVIEMSKERAIERSSSSSPPLIISYCWKWPFLQVSRPFWSAEDFRKWKLVLKGTKVLQNILLKVASCFSHPFPWVLRMSYALQEQALCSSSQESQATFTSTFPASQPRTAPIEILRNRRNQGSDELPGTTRAQSLKESPRAPSLWQLALRSHPVPQQRVGGARAGRESSKAGRGHKWNSAMKYRGEHSLMLTFTAPPPDMHASSDWNLWNSSSPCWICCRNLIRMHVCSYTQTRQVFKITHVSHKSHRPTFTWYLGNLVLNGIVKPKERTCKGTDHKEPWIWVGRERLPFGTQGSFGGAQHRASPKCSVFRGWFS